MKITKGSPIPPAKHPGRPRVHKLEEMNVGDCADIETSYASIYGCVKRFQLNREYRKWQFQIEKVGPKKVKVWRTA